MGETASPVVQHRSSLRLNDDLRRDGIQDAALVGRDPVGNVMMMEDHDGAYYAWKQAGFSGRILLHIDAHIDWAWIGDKDPRALLEARSSSQVESMLAERGLWNLTARTSAELVHIGNYIYPALKEAIVREFYWVVPDRCMESRAEQRKLVRQFQSLETINPRVMTTTTVTDHAVVAAIDDIQVTACTLSHLPRFREPILLDIDTDFLLIDPWESARAGDDLWKQLPWIWPDELVERLKEKDVRTDFVTIAYSVEGGFTPLSYKYLGDELALRLKHPELPERDRELLTHKRRAACDRRENKLDHAIAHYEAALALAPQDASSHFNLAYLYDKRGAYELAAARYREAVQLDPTYATANNNFGPIYPWTMLERAQAEYQRILRWDPQNLDAQYGLADLLARHERWEPAARLYRTVIELRPDHAAALRGLGYVCAKRRMWDEAIVQLTRSIVLQPDAGFAYFWLGEAYFHPQRWDEAIEAYLTALRRGFQIVPIHRRLGNLYLRKRKFHQAWKHYQKAVRLWAWRKLLRSRTPSKAPFDDFTGETAALTSDTRLAKSQKVPWRLIEAEAILLDLDEGEVLRLNPVGAEIWNAIDGTHTVAEIVAHICRTFDVSQRTARRDVHRFLERLLRYQLVEQRLGVSAGSA